MLPYCVRILFIEIYNSKLVIVKSNNKPLFDRDLMKLFEIQLTNVNNIVSR